MARRFDAAEQRVGCIYWAGYLVKALWQADDVRAFMQAGTCTWPLRLGRADYRDSPSYGMTWDPQAADLPARLGRGELPEMHAWVLLPDTMEIVDLSTRYWPGLCKEGTGMDWPGDLPPDYLWTPYNALPKGVRYVADRAATELGMKCFLAGRGAASSVAAKEL